MKKWLIASAICMIPVFFLGVCNPFIYVMMKQPSHSLKDVNIGRFMWYLGILAFCVSVIMTATIGMVRRADIIDKLDKKEEELNKEWGRVESLRRHYEKLITDQKQKDETG